MTPEELREWRQINGYSQTRLARELKVDVMTVSRWERGIRKEIPPFLELALQALECKGGEKEKKETKKVYVMIKTGNIMDEIEVENEKEKEVKPAA